DPPELFRHCLQVCRDSERAMTVAELAARMGHSPAVLGVVVAELADVDLVRLVRVPAWAERLRAWATSGTSPSAAPGPCPPPSAAVLGVVVAELAAVALWRLVRAPAWAERLRAWATSGTSSSAAPGPFTPRAGSPPPPGGPDHRRRPRPCRRSAPTHRLRSPRSPARPRPGPAALRPVHRGGRRSGAPE